VATAASTIHLFTGNNIGPRGDLASRALQIRLEVNCADPENRDFKHPDPIGWTQSHRVEILVALYTILLGNPTLDLPQDAPMKTRFKMWWRVVGSAIEHAARCAGGPLLDFGSLFLDQEAGDEDAIGVAEFLHALGKVMARGAKPFKASEVADAINHWQKDADVLAVRGFLFPKAPETMTVPALITGRRLARHIGQPVRHGPDILVLKADRDKHNKVQEFHVVRIVEW
jgi:hypothetical protein